VTTMSRLLRQTGIDETARLGSFVLKRGEGTFRPRHAGVAPMPGNDHDPAVDADEEAVSVEARAYAQGYDDARRTVEAEFAAERDALVRLVESLEVLRPEPTNALALLLAETVDRLVREIVGQVDVDPVLLLERTKAAAALVGENVEPSKLRLHPDDLPHLAEAAINLPMEADASLVRGTIVLETGHGWVEDGPVVRLERLRAELDKMAGRQ